MYKTFIILIVFFSTIVNASDNSISFLIDLKAGSFQPKIESYDQVYTDLNLMNTAGVGIGYNNGFLIARYR
ncbi:MAG: hypothetical protein HQ509_11655 [Candidatus Marinimicrobia bacterium]|nr:hypothetical protein [Candidatus Neomarinimicrobiota bacterium]